MDKGRVEGFTDAIVAIVMTIMILEIRPPRGTNLASLWREWPYFLAYFISFAIIASSWYLHHYFFAQATWVSKRGFWANNLWLLCMSFFPVSTGWVSAHMNCRVPEYFYFFVYVSWALSYYLLNYVVIKDSQGHLRMNSALSRIRHEPIDLSLMVIGTVLIYFWPPSGMLIVLLQSLTWAILTPPDSDQVVKARVDAAKARQPK